MKLSWLIGALVVAASVVAAILAFMYILPLDRQDSSPNQPIPFSHKLHAGDDAIPCLFCHRDADKSPVAGIPTVATCMKTCHPLMRLEIQQLKGYWDKKQPIPWVRVYRVPDFVYFPHMMHIRAGLTCTACHGEVAAMAQIVRSVKIEMGWCLNCHRQHKASIDCWTCHK